MTFGQPLFLLGLLAIPLMVAFFVWAEHQRKQSIARIGEATLIQRLTAGVNWRGRRIRNILWLMAFSLLLIALARPQWGEETQTIEQQGVQVMVALDVSQSMLAEDVLPDRLTRAKIEIVELMEKLEGDELGLVVFSGASFIQFPLTSDYLTARSFLDNAQPGIISRQGTAIGDAIRTAMRGFDENSNAQKVIVIVTDGEDGETNPLDAAQLAADSGIILYTIGFGSEDGELIPEYNQEGQQIGYKTDANGEPVLTKLDDSTLHEIAEIGGGRYFKATASGSELDALVAELNRLQQGDLDSRETTTHTEQFQWFLAVAVALLFVAELIPERVRQTARNVPMRIFGRFAASS